MLLVLAEIDKGRKNITVVALLLLLSYFTYEVRDLQRHWGSRFLSRLWHKSTAFADSKPSLKKVSEAKGQGPHNLWHVMIVGTSFHSAAPGSLTLEPPLELRTRRDGTLHLRVTRRRCPGLRRTSRGWQTACHSWAGLQAWGSRRLSRVSSDRAPGLPRCPGLREVMLNENYVSPSPRP